MITWVDVTNIAPELSTASVGLQTVILNYVGANLVTDDLGDKYTLAASYLAAHLATLAKGGGLGPSGPITAEQAGPISRSYANTFARWNGLAGFALTKYGILFSTFANLSMAHIGIVT